MLLGDPRYPGSGKLDEVLKRLAAIEEAGRTEALKRERHAREMRTLVYTQIISIIGGVVIVVITLIINHLTAARP